MSQPEERRPDPDEILARIHEEENRQTRGKLKIFLGYAAGVGKTYAMLEAAHQRQAEGVDVVVGYVETHHRKETEKLLDSLEVLPRARVEYRTTTLEEMDLDGIVSRRPDLVLVDELAHTNAPGQRHDKRYQDVEELLAAGVAVYTTVNIQHFESLKDVVRQITGIVVHETVPDRLLDEADEIELIDLPPDELLHRLKEGKVYIPEQASRALELFFRKGNLTALRELSMRRAAERVVDQMHTYMREKSIPGPWPAADRILVCLSSHPLGERLIRAGRRLADDLNAEWVVLFVETPSHIHMPDENRARIQKNLNLAEQLGARVVNVSDATVADAVVTYARSHNITKIIAGKPLRPDWLELLRGGSVLGQIIRQSGNIDVYIVSETESQPQPWVVEPARLFSRRWGRYIKSVLVVALATLLCVPVYSWLDPTNLVMLYLAAVVISAVYFGRGPSILASILSVLCFDFFFIHPQFTFTVSDTQYLLTFIGLLAVGLIISSSAAMLRDQIDRLKEREAQARTINALSRELTAAVNLEGVLAIVLKDLEETFQREAIILLPEGRRLAVKASTAGFDLDENEQAIALWAFQHGQPTGRGTETLSASPIRYTPLKTARGVVGVMGVKPHSDGQYMPPDKRLLLENFANLSALAIERAAFAEQASQAETLRATERLQSALLNSISHELRTPLASIMGALTVLEDKELTPDGMNTLDRATRLELIQSAAGQTRQLNRLVGNLLDMTRLQSGAVRLHNAPTDIQELVGAALTQMSDRLHNHAIETDIPNDLPAVELDSVLIAQVLVNLIDNALKYAPGDQPIHISARQESNELLIRVRDHGPGIEEGELQRVFEKFYRGSATAGAGGTGLGLAISRGIVEAHNGRIWGGNEPDGGLTVTLALPIEPDEA